MDRLTLKTIEELRFLFKEMMILHNRCYLEDGEFLEIILEYFI